MLTKQFLLFAVITVILSCVGGSYLKYDSKNQSDISTRISKVETRVDDLSIRVDKLSDKVDLLVTLFRGNKK